MLMDVASVASVLLVSLVIPIWSCFLEYRPKRLLCKGLLSIVTVLDRTVASSIPCLELPIYDSSLSRILDT
jgi:hypothetical protein